jgi:predicted NAD/FAD-binding protein
MSFSVHCASSGLEYQGSSLNGLFAQRRNLFSAPFHRMLLDILRFNRRARVFLQGPDDDVTMGEYLERDGYSRQFIEYYLVPMGAAIWSARPDRLLRFPARFIIAFFDNHGLLQTSRHPRWQTVQGGAARYVKALTQPFAHRIRLNWPATSIRRQSDGVIVASQRGAPERFDCVVLATHADQSLALLSDATDAEREILSSIPYQRNDAILHVDSSMLPRSRRAWASWNYRIPAQPGRPVVLTYNLNRLQGLRSPDPICVTLNDTQALDEARILARIVYHHPTYSREGQAAQKRFDEINGRNRTYFCGAYWGYGFHEDGVNSALAVGRCFGRRLESLRAASTRDTSSIGD